MLFLFKKQIKNRAYKLINYKRRMSNRQIDFQNSEFFKIYLKKINFSKKSLFSQFFFEKNVLIFTTFLNAFIYFSPLCFVHKNNKKNSAPIDKRICKTDGFSEF